MRGEGGFMEIFLAVEELGLRRRREFCHEASCEVCSSLASDLVEVLLVR